VDVGQYYLIFADDENTELGLIAGSHTVLALWTFDYLPPREWSRSGEREQDVPSPMARLRRAIAGKGAFPACDVAEGLARTDSIPVPVQCK
jgi:hypothetical protein